MVGDAEPHGEQQTIGCGARAGVHHLVDKLTERGFTTIRERRLRGRTTGSTTTLSLLRAAAAGGSAAGCGRAAGGRRVVPTANQDQSRDHRKRRDRKDR